MNFPDLLKELDDLNLPRDQYAITSSGTLAVRGIREANDIDLVVTDNLWSKLVTIYPIKEMDLCDSISIGKIEILGNFHGKTLYSPQTQINKADIIDGRRYVNLNMIIEFKKAMNREKDRADLDLIEKYIRTRLKDQAFGAVVVCRSCPEPLFLLIQQATGNYWSFPKGHKEGEETPLEAAKRELLEETGITQVDWQIDKSFTVEYLFFKDKQEMFKTNQYFLALVDNPVQVQPSEKFSHEVTSGRWVTFSEALELLDFEPFRKVLREAFVQIV